jgi:hypothetical protein
MVRLVFRPYTKLRRSICTLEPLQSSTRVSSGFDLASHSSPSFGSQHGRSTCASPAEADRGVAVVRCWSIAGSQQIPPSCFHFANWASTTVPLACAHVGLLGPCFKTGQVEVSLSTPPPLGLARYQPAAAATGTTQPDIAGEAAPVDSLPTSRAQRLKH